MRISLLLLVAVLPGALAAQATPAAATKVKKGPYTATCVWGAAPEQALGVGATLGKDPARAIRELNRGFEVARLKYKVPVVTTWHVSIITTWPADSVAWQQIPHPLTYADLALGMKGDSVVVLGAVEVICGAPPGAPDSSNVVAQRILQDRLQLALATAQARLR